MRKKQSKKFIKRFWWIGLMIFIFLIMITGKIYGGLSEDHFCQKSHVPTTLRPSSLKTASDWLIMGDVDYESGNCVQAIKDLDEALEINPNYAQAYNNRAFINMRLKHYELALSDLNKALEFRPDYPHALMNRGDIHKYLRDKTKAIADYDRVIAMGKEVIKREAVCGRRLMALYDENWFKAMWVLITKNDPSGCVQLYFEK